jgi:hypothetical protein
MDNNNSKLILNEKRIQSIKNNPDLDYELFSGSVKLFIVWYEDKNEDRMNEYLHCLRMNEDNKFIDNIYVIYEGKQIREFNNSKIKIINIDKRPTYADVFIIVNNYSSVNDINIVANTDIFFDDSLKYLFGKINKNRMFTLTRWNINNDYSEPQFHNRRDSQDVWIFYGKIKNIECNFYLGFPGCDNKLAYEIDKAGYEISNPSLSIKSYHYHKSEIRNYDKHNSDHRLSKPYLFISPSVIYNLTDNNKRILHIGLNYEGQTSLTDSLKTLGDYYYIDWRKKNNGNPIDLYNSIINATNKFMPDFIFMQIQTPNIITSKLLSNIYNNKNVIVLNWNGDIRLSTPIWMIELAKKHEHLHTAFTNFRDIENMKNIGINNVHYIQIGFEEKIYNPDVNKINSNEIVFTGSLYEQFPLYELRKDMFIKLKKEFGSSFQAFGGNFLLIGGSNQVAPNISAQLYKSAKISLSVNNINAYRYTSDRLLNILATGSFCLVNYYDGISLDFENNKHVVYWNDVNELISLIKKYYYEDNKRNDIAYNGMVEVWNNHRWIHRIKQIKNEILKW